MIDSLVNMQMQMAMWQMLVKFMEAYGGQSVDPETQTATQENGSKITDSDFSDLIQRISQQYGVDVDLVDAVIQTESNYNPNVVSYAGAQGLMQLMPATAQSLGVVNAFDPEQNVDGGVRLLRQLLNSYNGNVSLALAAYNAGPGAVATYGGIPPYQETQTYVSRVLSLLQ